jgi:DNA mismatch repair protein MutH
MVELQRGQDRLISFIHLGIIAQIVIRFGETRQPLLVKSASGHGIPRCIIGKHGNKIVRDLTVIHSLQPEIENN